MARVRTSAFALCSILLCASAGCVFNASYPMRPGDLARIDRSAAEAGTTRGWLVEAHRQLERLLPRTDKPALLTDDLTDENEPRDVLGYYGLDRERLGKFRGNFSGLNQTFNGVAMVSYIEKEAPPWQGFEDVWIPVNDDMSLHARLGLARDENGRPRDADCIVILPGIFGDLGVTRTRDLAEALVAAGQHALALEMRGAGRTEFRYPDKGFTFGVFESIDMIAVDEWLRARPHIRRSGLVGYCWGANVAMLSAWIERAGPEDPGVGPHIRPHVPAVTAEPHFAAGVIAFSPVLHYEKIVDIMDTPRSAVSAPILYGVQSVVSDRMERKGYGPPLHSLRRLIDQEFVHSFYGASQSKWRDALTYLRLVDYKGKPAGDKFERVRVPLLIVHSANDPLIPSQYVAEFVSSFRNTHLAAIVLPSGGHVGLATWSRPYYYSLIVNFFDPSLGPGERTGYAEP